MISDKVIEFIIKPFIWYENLRCPKRFKVGDKVRDKTQPDLWQDLTVERYDFYYNDYWWIYCSDNDPEYTRLVGRMIPFREYQLELLPPEFEFLQYDPKQWGDTDEDV